MKQFGRGLKKPAAILLSLIMLFTSLPILALAGNEVIAPLQPLVLEGEALSAFYAENGIEFLRNEDGSLVLDEGGSPKLSVGELPAGYSFRFEEGVLVTEGDPAVPGLVAPAKEPEKADPKLGGNEGDDGDGGVVAFGNPTPPAELTDEEKAEILAKLETLVLALLPGEVDLTTGEQNRTVGSLWVSYSANIQSMLPDLEIFIRSTGGVKFEVIGNDSGYQTSLLNNGEEVELFGFNPKSNVGDGTVASIGAFGYYFPSPETANGTFGDIEIYKISYKGVDFDVSNPAWGTSSNNRTGFTVEAIADNQWGFIGFNSESGKTDISRAKGDGLSGKMAVTLPSAVTISLGAKQIKDLSNGCYPAGSAAIAAEVQFGGGLVLPTGLPETKTEYSAANAALLTVFNEYFGLSETTIDPNTKFFVQADYTNQKLIITMFNSNDISDLSFEANLIVKKAALSSAISDNSDLSGTITVNYLPGGNSDPVSKITVMDADTSVAIYPINTVASGKSTYIHTINIGQVPDPEKLLKEYFDTKGNKFTVPWEYKSIGYLDTEKQIGLDSGGLMRQFVSKVNLAVDATHSIDYNKIWFAWDIANWTIPDGIKSVTLSDKASVNGSAGWNPDELEAIGFVLPIIAGKTTPVIKYTIDGTEYTVTGEQAMDVTRQTLDDLVIDHPVYGQIHTFTAKGGKTISSISYTYDRDRIIKLGDGVFETGSTPPAVLFRLNNNISYTEATALYNKSYFNAVDTDGNKMFEEDILKEGVVAYRPQLDGSSVNKTAVNISRDATDPSNNGMLNATGDTIKYTITVSLPGEIKDGVPSWDYVPYVDGLVVIDEYVRNLKKTNALLGDIAVTRTNGSVVVPVGQETKDSYTGIPAVNGSNYHSSAGTMANGWYAWEFKGRFNHGDTITITYTAEVTDTPVKGEGDDSENYPVENNVYVGTYINGIGGSGGGTINWHFTSFGHSKIYLSPNLLYGDVEVLHLNPVTRNSQNVMLPNDKIIVHAFGGTAKSDLALDNAALSVYISNVLTLDADKEPDELVTVLGKRSVTQNADGTRTYGSWDNSSSGIEVKFYKLNGTEVTLAELDAAYLAGAADYKSALSEIEIVALVMKGSNSLGKSEMVGLDIATIAKTPASGSEMLTGNASYAYLYTLKDHLFLNKAGSATGATSKTMENRWPMGNAFPKQVDYMLGALNSSYQKIGDKWRAYISDSVSAKVYALSTKITLEKTNSKTSYYSDETTENYTVKAKNIGGDYLKFSDRTPDFEMNLFVDILPVDERLVETSLKIQKPTGGVFADGDYTLATSLITLPNGMQAQRIVVTFTNPVVIAKDKALVVTYRALIAENKLLRNPRKESVKNDDTINMASVYYDSSKVFTGNASSSQGLDVSGREKYFWNGITITGQDANTRRIIANLQMEHKDKRIAPTKAKLPPLE